jgi:hypothetical protein
MGSGKADLIACFSLLDQSKRFSLLDQSKRFSLLDQSKRFSLLDQSNRFKRENKQRLIIHYSASFTS